MPCKANRACIAVLLLFIIGLAIICLEVWMIVESVLIIKKVRNNKEMKIPEDANQESPESD